MNILPLNICKKRTVFALVLGFSIAIVFMLIANVSKSGVSRALSKEYRKYIYRPAEEQAGEADLAVGDLDNNSLSQPDDEEAEFDQAADRENTTFGLVMNAAQAAIIKSKVKVACFVTTMEKEMKNKLAAVNDTWGPRCDKILYVMTSNISAPDILNVSIPDHRQTLTDKTKYAFTYLYKTSLNNFDWFLKGDDDTYVIMENLKFFLSHLDPRDPIYLGHQFKHFAPNGYMSGGASYVLSRTALRRLVENGYNVPGRCRHKGGAEDIETGRCLFKAGVKSYSSTDQSGRPTFHAHNSHIYTTGPLPGFLVAYSVNPVKMGPECCSQFTISFHYTGPKLMRLLDFIFYRISVYGRNVDYKNIKHFFKPRKVSIPQSMRRRPYPGETLEEYYKNQTEWRLKNTTIFINKS